LERIRRIEKNNLSAEVLDEVLAYIRTNHLSVGDKLPTEEELCDSLGVSRTAVREAMKGLKERGLIDSVPGRGTFIAAPDVAVIARTISSLLMLQQCSIKDVFEVRRCLEVFLAKISSARATTAQREKIKNAYEKIKSIHDDVDEALAADREFHVAIAEASGNRLGAILVENMMQLAVEMRRSTFNVDSDFSHMHEAIFRLVDDKNPDKIGEAMEYHFNMMDTVLQKFSAYEEDNKKGN